MASRCVYPFAAIVGQESMKRALLLNAINPSLGGVLIRGEKGTAKSTAARALARLLPEIEVVANCPFQSHPRDPGLMSEDCLGRLQAGERLPAIRRRAAVVDLPLGATEDRVIGTIDIEAAIRKGERVFEPGLLAQANRGILYVDEINLLEDHLVDILLDAAAMGVNTVEREGISFSHPARFVLVGTMNPEEGELRPQLLDRFGLCVEVAGSANAAERIEIVQRRLAFERDPDRFVGEFADREREIADSIVTAQGLLDRVMCPDPLIGLAVNIAVELETQGHRAELAMIRTARTLAAWQGREQVTAEDVREAAELVLPHRMRRSPFEDPQLQQDKLDESFRKHSENPPPRPEPADGFEAPPEGPPTAPAPPEGGEQEAVFRPETPFAATPISAVSDARRKSRSGGRSSAPSDTPQGRYVRARPAGENTQRGNIAVDATLRAAAVRQPNRGSDEAALVVQPEDVQEKVRQRKAGNTIVFVVDSSGSMGARQRMVAAKDAILSLLLDAYQKRDRVGLVAFRGDKAEVLLPPTSSVELAKRNLETLPTGGRTPFSHGLLLGHQLLRTEMIRDERTQPLLVLVSDGRANVLSGTGTNPLEEACRIATAIRADGIGCVVIDTESGGVKLGHMQRVAEALGARYIPMEEVRADRMLAAVHVRAGDREPQPQRAP